MNTYRNIILLAMLLNASVVLPAFNKQPDIHKVKDITFNIKLTVSPDATLPKGFADSLSKTQDILARIFSSQEFKDSLCKRSFADSSFFKPSKKNCFERIYSENGKVSGKGVYENLTNSNNIAFEWHIKKYTKGLKPTSLGFATACVYKITTHDYWLTEGQYLTLRLVKHLAHEFTHIRGYRHDMNVDKPFKWKRSEDPAYVVQRIVADIMLNWEKEGLL